MAFDAQMSGCRKRPPGSPGSGVDAGRTLDLLPEIRNKVYDVHSSVGCVVDREWMFELKARYFDASAGARARMLAMQARRLGGGMGEDVVRTWPRTP